MALAANDANVNVIQQLAYPANNTALLSCVVLSCCNQGISLLVLSGAPDRFPQKKACYCGKCHRLDWILFAE